MVADGRLGDAGEVLEIESPKRLVLRWRNEPELHEEGFSRATFELKPLNEVVKLASHSVRPQKPA
jgi:uncharacterized protein YndB with AHSA1/START domain